MKRNAYFILIVLSVLVLYGFMEGAAKLEVVTSYKYIEDLVRQVGGDRVTVTALADGQNDPHTVMPKPSFIAKLSRADLFIINGGQLEIGWVPAVLKQANNPVIMPGNKGFLDLMAFIRPLEIPTSVSRAQGDVHPEGNPHFHLDPNNIPILANAIKEQLCKQDAVNRAVYQSNYESFARKWEEKLKGWNIVFFKLKGVRLVVYHKLFEYLFTHYHADVIGTIEPLPGIPPSSRHIAGLIEAIKSSNVRLIIQDGYHSAKTAEFLSNKTGVKWIILPHDIGSIKEVTDLILLFDEIARRLTGL